jgi:hypothetical protein
MTKHRSESMNKPTTCTNPIRTLPDEIVGIKIPKLNSCKPAPPKRYNSKKAPKPNPKTNQQSPQNINITFFIRLAPFDAHVPSPHSLVSSLLWEPSSKELRPEFQTPLDGAPPFSHDEGAG